MRDGGPAQDAADMKLSDQLDARLYARVFAQHGRIHIPNLLRESDARAAHDALLNRTPWDLTAIRGNAVYDIKPQQYAAMSEEQLKSFEEELTKAAQTQYVARYRTLRLSNHGEQFDGNISELTALTKFLNGSAFLGLVRAVSGLNAIRFADAQATCFGPGDFLHPHYDTVTGKNRLLAYIVNLTPAWKVEWGGLLGFIDRDGHLAEAYTPKWNALNLLHVTQHHYVSQVSTFAAASRFSITGWLREE